MFLNAPVFGSNPFSKLGQYNKLSQYHPATPASMAH
jgi:hypothetical protein